MFQTSSLPSSTKPPALSSTSRRSKKWKIQVQGGPKIRREGPMKYFYFVILTGCEPGESSQRSQETSGSSIFLSETPGRLAEPSRLSRDLLILGFCCNPNHNSLISCYHICEPTCPRCSGCQGEPTNQFLLGMVANSQPCQSPSRQQSQQEQHSQVRTAQPWGVWHLPDHFCNIYLPGTWGPRVPAPPGTHRGAHTAGEGCFGRETLLKTQRLQS